MIFKGWKFYQLDGSWMQTPTAILVTDKEDFSLRSEQIKKSADMNEGEDSTIRHN